MSRTTWNRNIKVRTDYQFFQDEVRNQLGIEVSVFVDNDEQRVSIRTKDYAEYLLAKKLIAARTSFAIEHDFLNPLVQNVLTKPPYLS